MCLGHTGAPVGVKANMNSEKSLETAAIFKLVKYERTDAPSLWQQH